MSENIGRPDAVRIVFANGQATVAARVLDLNAAGHYRVRLPGRS